MKFAIVLATVFASSLAYGAKDELQCIKAGGYGRNMLAEGPGAVYKIFLLKERTGAIDVLEQKQHGTFQTEAACKEKLKTISSNESAPARVQTADADEGARKMN